MSLHYADVSTFLAAALVADGNTNQPFIQPGFDTDPLLQKGSPNELIFISIGGGAGPTTQLLFDRPFLRVAIVGRQRDYQSAEDLAAQVDRILCRIDHNTAIGNSNVLYISRTGGGPALSTHDDAQRYHFACSYIAETTLGL